MFVLFVLYSPEKPVDDPQWFHHVHAVQGELCVQPRTHTSLPRHETPAVTLLYLLLSQHLSHQGPADRGKQHRALYKVNTVLLDYNAQSEKDTHRNVKIEDNNFVFDSNPICKKVGTLCKVSIQMECSHLQIL